MVGHLHSCMAFYDTIRREGTTVKWSCNTAGFHKEKFETVKEAKNFMDNLKAISLSFNCGEILWEAPYVG